MSDWKEVAELLFPHVTDNIDSLRWKYPERFEKVVTRFAPSPTWYLHIWGLRTAFVSWKYAHQNKWKFILRIEDTDQKRIVDDAIDHTIISLKTFGIPINEGPLWEWNKDVGDYWPYIQSNRKYYYHVFVKEMVKQWFAYPCWMSPDELISIREQQMKAKIATWIYGNYSLWRNKNIDDVLKKLKSEDVISLGDDQDRNFVIRFRSHWNIQKKIIFDDVLRWKINMLDNYNDAVVLKSGWLPTYHMAHIVDDSLMGVNPVIRAEEWLTSVPLHLQLFEACGVDLPSYCHLSQLLKIDDDTWKKRKLSKRKDPEADVWFLFQQWFAVQWILEYLLVLVDSWYEERQREDETRSYLDYMIDLKKTNKAGALVDMVKLSSVNNSYLSRISNDELFYQTLEWAKMYKPDFAVLMENDKKYTISALSIERHTEKDPKRFVTFLDVEKQLLFFYDKEWEMLIENEELKIDKLFENNPNLNKDVFVKFVDEYLWVLDFDMDTQEWFGQLKEIWKKHGFAGNNKEFKEWWFVGRVWELAMFLRVVLCATKSSPDLFSVMKVLGVDRIRDRLDVFLG